MKITAKDVAQQAGVSQATVSLVFRNKPGVSEAVRAQVLETARSMGYTIEGARGGQSGIIQFVVYKRHGQIVSDNPFMEILAQGVSARAIELGYHPAISYFYRDKNCAEQINSIRSLKSDGLLLLATEMEDADMELFSELSVPVVLLDNYSSSMRWDAVVIDNQLGVRCAIQYLIQQGHERIGYLHSSVNIHNFRERYSGYLSGCRLLPERNAKEAAKRIVKIDVITEYATRSMRAYLASQPVLPSAFFADNDQIAAGCCRALREAGYRIPEDVSVIGFDDSPICLMTEPPLTTMAVSKERMGALAVSRLAERMKSPAIEHIRIAVSPELLVRDSVLNIRNFQNPVKRNLQNPAKPST